MSGRVSCHIHDGDCRNCVVAKGKGNFLTRHIDGAHPCRYHRDRINQQRSCRKYTMADPWFVSV